MTIFSVALHSLHYPVYSGRVLNKLSVGNTVFLHPHYDRCSTTKNLGGGNTAGDGLM
jgi:hypothetical protein